MERLRGDLRGLRTLMLAFLIVLPMDASLVWAGKSVSSMSTDASSAAGLKLNQKIDSLFTLLGSKSNDAGARWTLANDLEFGGRAKEAIEHYKWIVDSGSAYGVTSSRLADARTHLITCRFLSQVRKKNEPATSEDVSDSAPVVTKPSQQDTKITAASRSQMTKQVGAMETDTAQIRKQFGFLKEFAVSVAVTGGLVAVGANDQVIQTSLGLLYRWIDAPISGEPEERNRLVAGMLGALLSIIAEKDLSAAVNSTLAAYGSYASIEDLPANGFAREMEEQFKSATSTDYRYDIGDKLSVTIREASSSTDLTGDWVCEQVYAPGWGGDCRSENGTYNGVTVSTTRHIVQIGSTINLTVRMQVSGVSGLSDVLVEGSGALNGNIAEIKCVESGTHPVAGHFKNKNIYMIEILDSNRIKMWSKSSPIKGAYTIYRRS